MTDDAPPYNTTALLPYPSYGYPIPDLPALWGGTPVDASSPPVLALRKQIASNCMRWFTSYPASGKEAMAAQVEMLRQLNIGVLGTSVVRARACSLARSTNRDASVDAGATLPPVERIQLSADLTAYLWLLDDISDALDPAQNAKDAEVVMRAFRTRDAREGPRIAWLAADLMQRFDATCTTPGLADRLIKEFDAFFTTVRAQSEIRATGVPPTLEEYVLLRRVNSACRITWIMNEYVYGLALPEAVLAHPSMLALSDAANDIVTWSNDIYSYPRELSRNDPTHNMLHIAMVHGHALSLGAAAQFVAARCVEAMERFRRLKKEVVVLISPSGGDADVNVGGDVQRYMQGLEDWITGYFYWGFHQERYFGGDALGVTESLHLAAP
ncbi:Terpene cyclase [Mycena kentingensis (nom. inval.)]|nr:Terpene cyclase [Mycena kentingensis (nom. inval.)]